MNPQRREFLRTLAGGAAALSLSRSAFSQAAQAGPAAAKLTEKLTLITGAGNNIVALAGEGGSLLVDCGDAEHARDVPSGLPVARQDRHQIRIGTRNRQERTRPWPRPALSWSRTCTRNYG